MPVRLRTATPIPRRRSLPTTVRSIPIYSYLRGKVPGVQVSGTKIIIRGVNSVNSGTDVLVVVDGIKVNDPGSINVEEIESVNVIKDASASIYGFAGANGVIEVRTKGAGRR